MINQNKKIRFSTILSTFGNRYDRYCAVGYKKNTVLEEMFEDAKKVKDLEGLELVGGRQLNEENIDTILELKKQYGFDISCIIIDIFAQPKWSKGSLTSNDKEIRKTTINEVKKYMDIAPKIGCNLINLWFAQDGYDYIFQADYINAWNLMIDGIRECAEYRNDIKIGIEYKIKEPRTHCYIGTIGKTLSLLNKINKENTGVILDVGHSLYAYENMAESVALCKVFGDKLFHLHFNDNYRLWDDDMMVGSVHIPEYLELLYWLNKVSYKGWYSIDIYPYREPGIGALSESIKWLKALINIVENTDASEIESVLNSSDSIKSSALVRKMLIK